MGPLLSVLSDIRELHFCSFYKTRLCKVFGTISFNWEFTLHQSFPFIRKKPLESQIISWTLNFIQEFSWLSSGVHYKKQYLICSRFELRREYNTLWVEDGAGCVLWFFLSSGYWMIEYDEYNSSLCLQKIFLIDIYWNPSHWAQGIVRKG